MLDIDLQALEREPREWTERIPVEGGPWSDTGLRFEERPVAELRANFAGERDVHVQGAVRAPLIQECRRCLKDVRQELVVELDLMFGPEVDKEGDEEQVYLLETEAGSLDLAPAIREQLLLEVPPFPLCEEDCRGLCPRCGIDRNRQSCDCTLVEPDPRWEALRELKQEMQSEE